MPRSPQVPRLASRRQMGTPAPIHPAPQTAVAEGVAGVGTGFRQIGQVLMKEDEARAAEARAERERMARKLEAQAAKEEAERKAAEEKFKAALEASAVTQGVNELHRAGDEIYQTESQNPIGMTGRMRDQMEAIRQDIAGRMPSGMAQLTFGQRAQSVWTTLHEKALTLENRQKAGESLAATNERIEQTKTDVFNDPDNFDTYVAQVLPDLAAHSATWKGGAGSAQGREYQATTLRDLHMTAAESYLQKDPRRLQQEMEAGSWNNRLGAEDLRKITAALGPEMKRQEEEEYQGLLDDIWKKTQEMDPHEAIEWVKTATFLPEVKASDRRMLVNSLRADMDQQRQDVELARQDAHENIERGILQNMVAGQGSVADVMQSGLPTERKEHWINAFKMAAKEDYASDPALKNETLRQAYDRTTTRKALLELVGKKPGLTGADAEHRIQILETDDPARAPYMKRALSIFDAARKDGVYPDDFEWARAVDAFEGAVAAQGAQGQKILDIAEDILKPARETWYGQAYDRAMNWVFGKGEQKVNEEMAAGLKPGAETEEAALRRRAIEILQSNKKLVNEETIKLVIDQLRKAPK